MIIIGIILMTIGGILLGYGTNVNNDMDIQLDSFFSNGKINTGDDFIIYGTISLVLGGILLLAGIVKCIQDNTAKVNNNDDLLINLRNKNLITQEEYESKCNNRLPQTKNQAPISSESYLPNANINVHKYNKEQSDNKCPKCNYQLQENSHFCSNCGAQLTAEPTVKLCPHCGEEINFNSKFCKKCGTKQ